MEINELIKGNIYRWSNLAFKFHDVGERNIKCDGWLNVYSLNFRSKIQDFAPIDYITSIYPASESDINLFNKLNPNKSVFNESYPIF